MGYPATPFLSRIVSARTTQGELVAVGRVIGYCDAPTVTIMTPAGKRVHWRADLCEIQDVRWDVAEALMPLGQAAGTDAPQGEKQGLPQQSDSCKQMR